MRLWVALLMVGVIILTTVLCAAPAMAFSMPSVGGKYQLTASSPSDDPATSTIEVRPGEHITVQATAVISYKGVNITSPSITVNTKLQLVNGSKEIASDTMDKKINSLYLEDGKTYTMSGGDKIKVPPKTTPGIYKLNCTATATAGWMFMNYQKSEKKTFTVKVIDSKGKKSISSQEVMSNIYSMLELWEEINAS